MQDKLREKFALWRKDILLFCKEAFRLEPTAQQALVLESFQTPGSWTSVRSGHGVGKTACLALCAAWHTLLWSPCKTIVTAPTYPQLRDAFLPELSLLFSRAAPWLRAQVRLTSDRMAVVGREERQFMSVRTARPGEESSLQGARADYTAYLVDECYGVSDKVFQVIQGASSKGAVGSPHAENIGPIRLIGPIREPPPQTPAAKANISYAFRFLMGGNPTRSTGYAYESHHKNRKYFNCLRLNSEESPLVGAEFLRRMAACKGTDEYRVRVLGEHPLLSQNTLIPRALVEEAAARSYSPVDYEYAPLIVGCDPAWMGGDRSAIVARQGLWSKIILVKQGLDSVELSGIIAELWKTKDLWTTDPLWIKKGNPFGEPGVTPHKGALGGNPPCGGAAPSAVFIDIGMGNGVIDQLRRLGRNPIGVAFGGASGRDDCHLKRTEMWVNMSEWLKEGGQIENNEELIGELSDVEYNFNLAGKKVLEGKESMRERTGRSPDIADALALTFAFPVAKTPGAPWRREKPEAYDPWAEFE